MRKHANITAYAQHRQHTKLLLLTSAYSFFLPSVTEKTGRTTAVSHVHHGRNPPAQNIPLPRLLGRRRHGRGWHGLRRYFSPLSASPKLSPPFTFHDTTNLPLQTAKPSSPTCKATTQPQRACTHISSSYYQPASPSLRFRGSCVHRRCYRVYSHSPA